ncbi:hypothetical protein DSM106972_007380 [Dulcicalothrix desertica PCC 7102]|uniref:Uncharacterized protein n=1 Tax=Dulcicalothrix desertica PCC 7102 TaxID=232991 RepID=A0A3S1CWZ3_9CYAN|nr:hypothetical protein [Dulcicalothrix desertica]RUT10243.1 hypothetical protein DSM106972_007380 [Dulcicalothrix desertica PCC 7102]TWH40781.1 hypothetical protein CAL7102_10136 [Dulcicalothrix desertica PCC 7102]
MPQNLIYRASGEKEALRQGEILTGVVEFKPIVVRPNSTLEDIKFEQILHPYAVIVSQDCDLDWDYTARQNKDKPHKLLNSILFCELYTAQDIRTNKTLQINSRDWSLVQSNRNQQYHFFEKVASESELYLEGLAELTADFKQIFAIDAEFLYHQINNKIARRRTIVKSPYLEDFSYRFHSYHGRIALPAQHESEKGL